MVEATGGAIYGASDTATAHHAPLFVVQFRACAPAGVWSAFVSEEAPLIPPAVTLFVVFVEAPGADARLHVIPTTQQLSATVVTETDGVVLDPLLVANASTVWLTPAYDLLKANM